MARITISVAKDFSRWPGGLTYADGENSAQAFRENILLPAIEKYDNVLVELDGTIGYASSWLQTAFQDIPMDRIGFIGSAEEVAIYSIRKYQEEYQVKGKK